MAARSCSWDSPSKSSSSDKLISSWTSHLSGIQPVAVRDIMCIRLSPPAGPSFTHSTKRLVAAAAAVSSARFAADAATSRKDLTQAVVDNVSAERHCRHAMNSAASCCMSGSLI